MSIEAVNDKSVNGKSRRRVMSGEAIIDKWEVIRYDGSSQHLYCKTISRRVSLGSLVQAMQRRGTYVVITDSKGVDITAKCLLPRLPKLSADKVNAVIRFAYFASSKP
jgi:hypothetical protein